MKLYDSFIKRGNNILNIDLNYFISGGFWTSIPNFLETGFRILVTVILTRMISQQLYGEYRFFISVLAIFAIFGLPGMGSAIIQSVARKHDRSFLDGTRLIMTFSLLGSFGLISAAGYFYLTGREHMVLYFLLTAAIFPFLHSFKTFADYLVAREEYKKQAKYKTFQVLILYSLFIITILLTKNLTIIILAYVLLTSLSNYLMHTAVRKKYSKKIKKSKKDSKLFNYGSHLSLIAFAPIIATNIDKILIAYFLGLKMVAVYAVAQTVSQQHRLTIRPIIHILLPKLSRQDGRKTYALLMNKLPYIIGFSTVVCLVGIILAPLVVRILFPPEYSGAIIYSQALFLGHIFGLGTIVFSNFLVAQKRTKNLYKTTLYPSALRFILLAALLPTLGVWGVILAEILGNYYYFGLHLYLCKKDF